MKITKRNYPERLRRVINSPNSCQLCAATMDTRTPNNWTYRDVSQLGTCESVFHKGRKGNICETICRNFVGLKPAKGIYNCPCLAYGKKRAIAMAEKYLKLWDKGQHHWQKGEK